MSLGSVFMAGTSRVCSRCGPLAAQPASTAETIKIKRVDFILRLLRKRGTPPFISPNRPPKNLLLFHRAGMPDRERELRDLGVPEFSKPRCAQKAHRESGLLVRRGGLGL